MSYLLDVDLLTACAQRAHERNAEASEWLAAQPVFFTCPLTELGFLRVSMCPAYRYSFESALLLLTEIRSLTTHQFLTEAVSATELPRLASRHLISDAYLVKIARSNRLKLATLDQALCRAPWADGTAVHPF